MVDSSRDPTRAIKYRGIEQWWISCKEKKKVKASLRTCTKHGSTRLVRQLLSIARTFLCYTSFSITSPHVLCLSGPASDRHKPSDYAENFLPRHVAKIEVSELYMDARNSPTFSSSPNLPLPSTPSTRLWLFHYITRSNRKLRRFYATDTRNDFLFIIIIKVIKNITHMLMYI